MIEIRVEQRKNEWVKDIKDKRRKEKGGMRKEFLKLNENTKSSIYPHNIINMTKLCKYSLCQ